MKNINFKVVCTIFVLFFASGCASSKVGSTAFIKNPSLLNKSGELEKYYIVDNFNPKQFNGVLVLIKDIKISHTDIDVDEINKFFRDSLTQAIRNTQIFNIVTNDEDKFENASSVLICKAAITNLDPGNRMGRLFAGEWGAGHTNVQIEGYFIDSNQAKEVFIFADRRIGAALTDITGGDSKILIKEDIRNITQEVAKVLKKVSEKY